jgi:dimeric dUTPase (all-alpha-NTP-PPase superfamily)
MAGGITLEQAQAQLQSALDSLIAARQAQSYQVGSQSGARRVDRANLAELEQSFKYWEQKIASIQRGGGIRTMYGVPCD